MEPHHYCYQKSQKLWGCFVIFFLSHLSLHDEPDGESDVGRVLSGLTVEGSHHDDVWRLESDENDEGSLQLERRWRRKRDGMERAVAAEVRQGVS